MWDTAREVGDELISDILLQRQDDQLEPIYNSLKDLPEAMDDREGWRERVRETRAGGATWWWWWWNKGTAKVLGANEKCIGFLGNLLSFSLMKIIRHNHIISEWRKLAQEKKKSRYGCVGKVIHWELCKKLKFDHIKKWYMHKGLEKRLRELEITEKNREYSDHSIVKIS